MSDFTDRLDVVLKKDKKGYVICTVTTESICHSVSQEILEAASDRSERSHFSQISDTRLVYMSVIFIDIVPSNRLDTVLVEDDVQIVHYNVVCA